MLEWMGTRVEIRIFGVFLVSAVSFYFHEYILHNGMSRDHACDAPHHMRVIYTTCPCRVHMVHHKHGHVTFRCVTCIHSWK